MKEQSIEEKVKEIVDGVMEDSAIQSGVNYIVYLQTVEELLSLIRQQNEEYLDGFVDLAKGKLLWDEAIKLEQLADLYRLDKAKEQYKAEKRGGKE